MQAARGVDVSGLIEGPLITSAGWVWEGSDGIVVTSPAGRSTVLAPPDAPNWDNLVDMAWFGQEWWVLARPSGVVAGRVGGPLRSLPLLDRCNPGATKLTPGVEATHYAVSGDHLYAALPSSCIARPENTVQRADQDIDLRSHRSHALAPDPRQP